VTSLHCRLRGRGVYYERFGGAAAVAAYYARALRAHAIARDSGSCADRENVDGPYDQGGPTTGRVACYRVDGDPWLVWTHTRLHVVSTLLGLPSDSPREAYGVWKDAGPYGCAGGYISLRPSSARPTVSSSACSRSAPTGRPLARRVTRTRPRTRSAR
jgi:hypothetical protein